MIIPYILYFQSSCFAKENTKQSDHAGRAAASKFKKYDSKKLILNITHL